jgi:hypothetical protein
MMLKDAAVRQGKILLAKRNAYRAKKSQPPVNPLRAYFEANQGRLIHKWMHYFDIYDRHFAPSAEGP